MEIMTRIDAKKYVKSAFPPDEGAKLAETLLADSGIEWEELSVDLRGLPASLLISAFFNSFLQRVYEAKPRLLDRARRIEWEVKFGFQKDNVRKWMAEFQPFEGGAH